MSDFKWKHFQGEIFLQQSPPIA